MTTRDPAARWDTCPGREGTRTATARCDSSRLETPTPTLIVVDRVAASVALAGGPGRFRALAWLAQPQNVCVPVGGAFSFAQSIGEGT